MLVAGFGLAITDVLVATDSVTLRTKNRTSTQMIQMGGVIPTALIVLTRLGIPTQFYSMVGKDMFGDTLLSILQKEGIDHTHVARNPDVNTPFASVVLHDGDQRTIFYTTGKFSEWRQPGFAQSLAPDATYLLVDGHNNHMAYEFAKQAQSQKTQVLLDLGNPKPGLDELIAKADGVVIPRAYWKTLGLQDPETIAKKILKKGPRLVVVTMEEKGCLVATRDSLFHQPSYPVKAIDTNGAGDVFFGSFTYGLLKKWPLPKAAQFASASAAQSCTVIGKDKKIPRSEEGVLQFIANA